MYMTRLILSFLLLISTGLLAESPIKMLGFSKENFQTWQEKSFQGNTQYNLITSQGSMVLQAKSNNSASGLFYEVDINLLETPYLNWRWRVERALPNLDETSKAGDDYAARVYVLFKPGFFTLYPYSMSYVWSGSSERGSSWKNAYTDRVVMLALQNNNEYIDQWRTEKRNILEDIKKYFDSDIENISGIAVMTDTDNSHQQAVSYYADVFFSTE